MDGTIVTMLRERSRNPACVVITAGTALAVVAVSLLDLARAALQLLQRQHIGRVLGLRYTQARIVQNLLYTSLHAAAVRSQAGRACARSLDVPAQQRKTLSLVVCRMPEPAARPRARRAELAGLVPPTHCP